MNTPDPRITARVPQPLHDQFHAACESRGVVASHVIRDFMHDYVKEWEAEVRRGASESDLLRRIDQLERQLKQAGVTDT